ncbi:HAD family hydrolase [Anaerovorax odorimutans]|uniref:HAD family hydrolase n=1 Tax=Anaerovorax odorimutans TaxID=109327 RepID=UPI0004278E94|nr:HAD family phosphatase [Anaerovorax odorimutans]
MNLKGIIFDLDGTLLDSMELWSTIGEKYLKLKGYKANKDLQQTLKTMSLIQAAQYFRKTYGITDSEEMIIKQIDELVEIGYYKEIPLKKGVLSLLNKLHNKDIKMCIATATDKHLAEAALKRLDILGYFCGVLTCSEVGFGKDRPEIFRKALKLLNTDINETVIIEDNLHAIKTAKSAEFMVYGVHDKFSEKDSKQIRLVADKYFITLEDWEI